MAAPQVLSIIPSLNTLSDEPGFTIANVDITFDQPVATFVVMIMGASHTTGTLAHREARDVEWLATKTVDEVALMTVEEVMQLEGTLTAEIDYLELYQEGSNVVNIYGLSVDTLEWTEYGGV